MLTPTLDRISDPIHRLNHIYNLWTRLSENSSRSGVCVKGNLVDEPGKYGIGRNFVCVHRGRTQFEAHPCVSRMIFS